MEEQEDLDSIIDILNMEPEQPKFAPAKDGGYMLERPNRGLPPLVQRANSKSRF